MNTVLSDQIRDIICKHAPTSVVGRQALVFNAWDGSPLVTHIDYSGNKLEFCTQLYMRGMLFGSLDDGTHAMAALLAQIAVNYAEKEDKDKINHLLISLSNLQNPAPSRRQHDVFLSYAREDQATMEQVRGLLLAAGLSVWTDDNLAIGTPNWVNAIDTNLRAAGAIVVLCSLASSRSTWVQEEWLMAQRLGLGVFPVLLAGDGFPLGLQSSQGIDARLGDLPLQVRGRLVPALMQHLGLTRPTPQPITSPSDALMLAKLRGAEQRLQQRINTGLARAERAQHERARTGADGLTQPDRTTWAFFTSGQNNFIAGKLQEAVADFTNALKLDRDNVGAYFNRGCAYASLHDYPRAIQDFTEVIRLKQTSSDAYSHRGGVYLELSQFDLAVKDYTAAIHLNPTDAVTRYNRGVAYHKLQQYDRAIVDYIAAAYINPTYPSPHVGLGSAYYRTGRYGESIDAYTTYKQLTRNADPLIERRIVEMRAALRKP